PVVSRREESPQRRGRVELRGERDDAVRPAPVSHPRPGSLHRGQSGHQLLRRDPPASPVTIPAGPPPDLITSLSCPTTSKNLLATDIGSRQAPDQREQRPAHGTTGVRPVPARPMLLSGRAVTWLIGDRRKPGQVKLGQKRLGAFGSLPVRDGGSPVERCLPLVPEHIAD